MKLCNACATEQPLDQFRMNRHGYRPPECRLCRNRRERERTAVLRMEQMDQFAKELSQARTIDRQNALCMVLIRQFGGAEKFAAYWRQHFETLIRKCPSRTFRHLDALSVLFAVTVRDSRV